jgi:ABC-type molybdate transport system permease subunit
MLTRANETVEKPLVLKMVKKNLPQQAKKSQNIAKMLCETQKKTFFSVPVPLFENYF